MSIPLKRIYGSKTKFFHTERKEVWDLENKEYVYYTMRSGTPEEVKEFLSELPQGISHQRVVWSTSMERNGEWKMEHFLPEGKEVVTRPNDHVRNILVEGIIGTRPNEEEMNALYQELETIGEEWRERFEENERKAKEEREELKNTLQPGVMMQLVSFDKENNRLVVQIEGRHIEFHAGAYMVDYEECEAALTCMFVNK